MAHCDPSVWTLTTDVLLRPDLLDAGMIRRILESRGWTSDGQVGVTQEEMMLLYNDLVLPKPQREHNLNTRLGSRLHENQPKSKIQQRHSDEEMRVDVRTGCEISSDKDNAASRINLKRRNPSNEIIEGRKTVKEDTEGPPVKKRQIKNEIKWP